MAIQRTRAQSAYGYPTPMQDVFPQPVVMDRAPTTADQGEIGQLWVNSTANTAYVLCSITAGSSNWITSPSGGITAASFTISPGNLLVDTGNATIAGTLNVAGLSTLGALAAGATTLTGVVALNGNTTIAGDLDITGDVTFNGDFDLTSAVSAGITSTWNGAGAIYLLANGGVNETILITSGQGTGAGSININSIAGGVIITANRASATAIDLVSNNAVGGIRLGAGTGGIAIGATNGAITMTSGTGTIGISTDATVNIVDIGTGAGAKTISIGGTAANTITGTTITATKYVGVSGGTF